MPNRPLNTDEIKERCLKEKISELNLHYLELCKKRDDYTPAMIESELTDQVMSLISETSDKCDTCGIDGKLNCNNCEYD